MADTKPNDDKDVKPEDEDKDTKSAGKASDAKEQAKTADSKQEEATLYKLLKNVKYGNAPYKAGEKISIRPEDLEDFKEVGAIKIE